MMLFGVSGFGLGLKEGALVVSGQYLTAEWTMAVRGVRTSKRAEPLRAVSKRE